MKAPKKVGRGGKKKGGGEKPLPRFREPLVGLKRGTRGENR